MGKNYRNFIVLGVFIVLLIVGVVMTNKKGSSANMNPEEAKTAAQDFITKILMNGESTATVTEVSLYEPKVYNVKVKIEGSEELVDSYISADGKLFFPQSLDIAELSGTAGTDDTAAADTAVTPVESAPKSDKPVVELFVMSHCPYGTQIEKGILPVVAALGDKIDFNIKFVNYAMHGDKELSEQMLQYCIQSEQRDKYTNYLNCFLQAGDSASCLKTAQVDSNKANACAAKVDKQYRILEVFEKKEGWDSFPPFPIYEAENVKYGVQGSPTLVINGKQIDSGRDSASLAGVICGAFNTLPEACNQTFSSASPAPGFGTATTSGTTNAECAPAV